MDQSLAEMNRAVASRGKKVTSQETIDELLRRLYDLVRNNVPIDQIRKILIDERLLASKSTWGATSIKAPSIKNPYKLYSFKNDEEGIAAGVLAYCTDKIISSQPKTQTLPNGVITTIPDIHIRASAAALAPQVVAQKPAEWRQSYLDHQKLHIKYAEDHCTSTTHVVNPISGRLCKIDGDRGKEIIRAKQGLDPIAKPTRKQGIVMPLSMDLSQISPQPSPRSVIAPPVSVAAPPVVSHHLPQTYTAQSFAPIPQTTPTFAPIPQTPPTFPTYTAQSFAPIPETPTQPLVPTFSVPQSPTQTPTQPLVPTFSVPQSPTQPLVPTFSVPQQPNENTLVPFNE
jgi:hypothetical protein